MVRAILTSNLDMKKVNSLYQKADKVVSITNDEIETMQLFTYWVPTEFKNGEIYSKAGKTHIIATYTQKVEHIVNNAGNGLQMRTFIQMNQQEKDKPGILLESENIIQQVMFFVNEEEEEIK